MGVWSFSLCLRSACHKFMEPLDFLLGSCWTLLPHLFSCPSSFQAHPMKSHHLNIRAPLFFYLIFLFHFSCINKNDSFFFFFLVLHVLHQGVISSGSSHVPLWVTEFLCIPTPRKSMFPLFTRRVNLEFKKASKQNLWAVIGSNNRSVFLDSS